MTENETRIAALRDLTIQGLRYAIPDAKVERVEGWGLAEHKVSVRMSDGSRFVVAVHPVLA